MRRVARVSLVVVAVLALLGFGAARYLLGRTPVPETSDYALDLDEVRRLAGLIPGERPIRVDHQVIAEAALPRGAIFAGESLRTPFPMVHGVYRVVYPDGFGVIDAGFDEAALREMDSSARFDAEGYAAVQRALGDARWIIATHEHGDHIGGLARFAEPERLKGRLWLTREQLANREALEDVGFPEELRRTLTPLGYDRYHPLSPGVILIKAAGHTPGTQMIYVQLADGKELLFLGDVAWHMDQIRELWYRPRLVTDFFIGEDRDAVMSQFRTLHDLAEREPSVTLIPSHDVEQRRALIQSGVLHDGFAAPAPAARG